MKIKTLCYTKISISTETFYDHKILYTSILKNVILNKQIKNMYHVGNLFRRRFCPWKYITYKDGFENLRLIRSAAGTGELFEIWKKSIFSYFQNLLCLLCNLEIPFTRHCSM